MKRITAIIKGEVLARQLCSNCHLYPEPALLDRHTWSQYVLPEMANYYGWYLNTDYRYIPIHNAQAEELALFGNVPEKPTLSEDEWQMIVKFYQQKAPEKPIKSNQKIEISTQQSRFEVAFSPLQNIQPGVTLIRHYAGEPHYPFQLLHQGLHRPVHLHAVDLDRDGNDDLLVSEFGGDLGGLS